MENKSASSTDEKYNTKTELDAAERFEKTPERVEGSKTKTEITRLKKLKKSDFTTILMLRF